MRFQLEPLRVVCDSCGTSAETYDYAHPDLAVTCRCCPVEHDHAGLGCRPVTIYATARLTLFELTELMEMAAGAERDERSGELTPPAGETPVTS